MCRSILPTLSGPPPRTRGTRLRHRRLHGAGGTTPAYAGNAADLVTGVVAGRDHPRVRGEREVQAAIFVAQQGPPPRTRGTRPPDRPQPPRPGTTPAYAGNAPPAPRRCAPSRDHPRVRGERSPCMLTGTWSRGPPPRTRGTHQHGAGGGHHVGTTPAYAGNADVCGSQARHRGTTPAYAGNARCPCTIWPTPGDHPRVRGERAMTRLPALAHVGPPPRTRGTRAPPPASGGALGTTPAYAGNATPTWSYRPATWDHPRVRGERFFAAGCTDATGGPPPRTRGTHPATVDAHVAHVDHPRVRGGGPRLLTCGVVDQLLGFCSVWFGGGLFHAELVGVRRPNRRRLAALLHPWGRAGLGMVCSVGRRMRVMPSKSTGVHWWS